jgi:hypothetical protein
MSKVATFQVLFDDFGDNGPPESILPFITFIIYLYKLLKVISDALIERAHFEESEDDICPSVFPF